MSAVTAANPKAGGVCPKAGTKKVYQGKTYTCLKSGKKLVWSKGVTVIAAPKPSVTPTPSPTPIPSVSASPTPTATATPTPSPSPTDSKSPNSSKTFEPVLAPTSFDNLYENRAGISRAAWGSVSETIKKNVDKSGAIEVLTGPNTKPYYDDYLNVKALISRAFPKQALPAKTLVIRYNYKDLGWAETTTRAKLTASEYEHLDRNEGGKLVTSNCDNSTANCRGSKQQTTQSGLSIILQGVENSLPLNDPTGTARFDSGMLEVHEYFHSLQRIPIMGKSNIWPHAWFREGGAEWAQNAIVNYDDFNAYRAFITADCTGSCARMTEADIKEFLTEAKENYLPQKFESWLNYSFGSKVVEALVAIKGHDILIDMYAEMGKGISFDAAFKNLFEVEWSYAIPILAKTIYANLNGK
jgi:hypothetical protein